VASNGLQQNSAHPDTYHEGTGLATGGTVTFTNVVDLHKLEGIGLYDTTMNQDSPGCTSITFQALDASGTELWRWQGSMTGQNWNTDWEVFTVALTGVKTVKILDKAMTNSFPYCFPSFGRFKVCGIAPPPPPPPVTPYMEITQAQCAQDLTEQDCKTLADTENRFYYSGPINNAVYGCSYYPFSANKMQVWNTNTASTEDCNSQWVATAAKCICVWNFG
jgi:hypothetical protein